MPDIRTMVTPTHACGCEGRPQRDNEAGRAMVAAFALTECWTCEKLNAGLAAQQMAETLGLPELNGSREPSRKGGTSQYDYSVAVREQIRQRIETAYPDPSPLDMTCTDAVLYGIRDSRWWLDRKDTEPFIILEWIRPVVELVMVAR